MSSYDPVVRGDIAIQTLIEIKGITSDENIMKWRNICCVNPNIICKVCPIGIPPEDKDHGWCHEWFEASQKLRLRRRLENIKKYVGELS